MKHLSLLFIILIHFNAILLSQWTNRYPKIEGMSHQIYLEGYDLPTLSMGPIDPAVAPDNLTIAFSSRGWIWLFSLETGIAKRLTNSGPMDFRPNWSPNGSQLAFVRDDGSDTWIVIYDILTGKENIINSPAIDLDPVFSANGGLLFYSSAKNGTLDLWQHSFATGKDSILFEDTGSQLKAQPHLDGSRLLYLDKDRSNDIKIMQLNKTNGSHFLIPNNKTPKVLKTERITSMTRPALSPNGNLVVYNWPTQEDYELRLISLIDPTTSLFLTNSDGLPLTPSWSSDSKWIYFSEADNDEVFHLKRISVNGGDIEIIKISSWDWGEPISTLRIKTKMTGSNKLIPTRISVKDNKGHFVIPDKSQSRFDGQNGVVFFYSNGSVELKVPTGSVEISVVQGLNTPLKIKEVNLNRTGLKVVTIFLKSIWDPRDDGWISGDHHFHLNYGGQYQLTPEDLFPMMAGEALDVATPQLANLHNRFGDQKYWGWKSPDNEPLILFAQEIRSHFLGHLGLLGNKDLFWPWIWGPGYQVYNNDDRPNSTPLDFTKEQGGLSLYVHPFSGDDPFSQDGMKRLPRELVADAVLAKFDLLEIVCLWSNSIGTSNLWYHFLNIGIPIAPSGGTDVMNNLYRTMAIGTTRVYAQTNGNRDWDSYAEALKSGKSFVTNGPMLDFKIEKSSPGEVISPSMRANWTLDLHSSINVDSVEVIVNGKVVWSDKGLDKPGSILYKGSIDLPPGGWIASRARGGKVSWPVMDSYIFAHTAPIWIDFIGSTDHRAKTLSAIKLLNLLEISEQRMIEGYKKTPIPNLKAHYNEARNLLQNINK